MPILAIAYLLFISLDMYGPKSHKICFTHNMYHRGCKLDDRDKNGCTPFLLAASHGCQRCNIIQIDR